MAVKSRVLDTTHLRADAGAPSSAVEQARELAQRAAESLTDVGAEASFRPLIEQALTIHAVENELLSLFAKGKLHGTIHTCIGQEFTGVMLGKYLRDGDFVTSNHRCHGHFIAATGNWRGLMDEIIGNSRGVSHGIGSSQHLYAPNFISNGPQGALLPVAAGIALSRKRGSDAVVLSYIGEGTLGEGVLYETLNLDSLYNLPHLIVCENNFYSQSTPQSAALSGGIKARAAAFDIGIFEANTWDLSHFKEVASAAVNYVRQYSKPAFLLVRTYRLNAHSKGDDDRDPAEVKWFREHDPLTVFNAKLPWASRYFEEVQAEVRKYAEEALTAAVYSGDDYFIDQLPTESTGEWRVVESPRSDERVHQRLNAFYREFLGQDRSAWFIGEDIADPYGGAFKISKGLSSEFPERVLSTPISEAAIVGLGIGLAITGQRAFVEIMFGDFMTHALDQLISNASKMYHMYAQELSCPVVVRAPMGGGRGYGPTHSQSLERLFVGIDNCAALSLNSLVDPSLQLANLGNLMAPAVLFENKTDYTLRVYQAPSGFELQTNGAMFPTLRLRPLQSEPTATIVAYGGMARVVCDGIVTLFEKADLLAEVIVPLSLSPLDIEPIVDSVKRTGTLIVMEEGTSHASTGAEVVARVVEKLGTAFRVLRMGKRNVPIPSAPLLERETLPGLARLCREVETLLGLE
jgi:2-oxoisovalerate dehydrogenase E1 component